MAKTATKRRKPGRPKGSINKDRPHVVHPLPQCPGCGSTDREPYGQPMNEMAFEGKVTITRGCVSEEFAYEHIRWLPTRCRACGQYYAVRELSRPSG